MGLRKPIAAAIGVLALAATIISPFEGTELQSYRDAVGKWTICKGHTETAAPGQTKTPEECEALLYSDMGKSLAEIDRAVEVPLSDQTKASLVSFVFNVGAGAFQRSTLLKKLNTGDIVGACNELPRWVYAGGKRLGGLVRRRAAERDMCLAGIAQ
jgi:lysozyme